MSVPAAADSTTSAPQPRRPRVLFLNRSYWPDAEATGQLLTELCEDLAGEFDVQVLVGQPNANPSGAAYRRSGTEVRNGVTIRRVFNFRFPKRILVGRLLNLLSYFAGSTLKALFGPRPDVVVVETDPPWLSILGSWMKRWRGSRYVLYLQDIYPDIAVAIGKLPEGRIAGMLRSLLYASYRRADHVVVLSTDMRDLMETAGVPRSKISIVPNWADVDLIRPVKTDNPFRSKHALGDKFVVMYSGNMGLTQRLENLLAAAGMLRDRPEVEFLLIGQGATRKDLERQVAEQQLTNVRFLDYQPKSELAASLSAPDVHFVPLDPAAARCLMPSKLYGILAAGTAILAAAPENCELGRVITENWVGLVVPPHDPQQLAAGLRWCVEHRLELVEMGRRARQTAESSYTRPLSVGAFAGVLRGAAPAAAGAARPAVLSSVGGVS